MGEAELSFITTLRERGLQVTHQRLAIYQVLCHSPEHPSAELIYKQIRKRFPMISFGTVYKVLEKFHEVGLITKLNPIAEVARYDADVSFHHHLFCIGCHTIMDVLNHTADLRIAPPKDSGFEVVRQQVLFLGYCPACRTDRAAPRAEASALPQASRSRGRARGGQM